MSCTIRKIIAPDAKQKIWIASALKESVSGDRV
jgi:hypothetical protein